MTSARNQLLSDMRDLQVWLETFHPGAGRLAIRRERDPTDPVEYGTALLVGGRDNDAHRRAKLLVCAALAAMGWRATHHVESGVTAWLDAPPTSRLTAHERMRACGRVEQVLREHGAGTATYCEEDRQK